MAWLAPALGLVGSLFGGNPGQAAANNQQQTNQEIQNLIQKYGPQFQQMAGFFQNEANQGMDPAVLMAAQSGNDAEFLRQMNSASAAQGPGYRGAADVPYEQAISDAMLNSQIAGQQQAFKNQAEMDASNVLGNFFGSASGALGGMSNQYAQQAQNSQNPFMGAASALAGGGGDALGSLFSRMFGGGGGGSVTAPTPGQFALTNPSQFNVPAIFGKP